MYKLIKTTKTVPPLDRKTFTMYDATHYMTYIRTQPNVKCDNYEEFKQIFINDFIENENDNESDRPYEYENENEYINEKWFKTTLQYLGEEKYMAYVERMLCTPLHGNWTDYYITLGPIFDEKMDRYLHVQFDKVPSIMELLYVHTKEWQKLQNDVKFDISNIGGNHYSMVNISGSSDQLNIKFPMAS